MGWTSSRNAPAAHARAPVTSRSSARKPICICIGAAPPGHVRAGPVEGEPLISFHVRYGLLGHGSDYQGSTMLNPGETGHSTIAACRTSQATIAKEDTVIIEPVDWDVLLKPSQVAAMLAVEPKTVTSWANAGIVSSTRTPGGHRRYRKSEIVALLAEGHHPQHSAEGPASPLDASMSTGDPSPIMEDSRWGTTHSERVHVADADRVANAVAVLWETQAATVARDVILVADAVAAAAQTAAEAAQAAREATSAAAEVAAAGMASTAARTAAAVQLRADAAAERQGEAAFQAATVVAAAIRPGHQREGVLSALRIAAIVEAAAAAAASTTAADAACVADAVTAAAAQVALVVAAAALAIETEVATTAATLHDAATAAARRVAADTDDHRVRSATGAGGTQDWMLLRTSPARP